MNGNPTDGSKRATTIMVELPVIYVAKISTGICAVRRASEEGAPVDLRLRFALDIQRLLISAAATDP